MSNSKILEIARKRLVPLRRKHADLQAQMYENIHIGAGERSLRATARSQTGQSLMRMTAQNATNQLTSLGEIAHDADQGKRAFQSEHGIFRDLKRPDPLKTLTFLMFGWVTESIFTTVSLFADGHLDLIPAVGFAATFSTVNVGLGLAAGACLRYAKYHQNSPVVRSGDRLTRKTAFAGLLTILGIDALMIFAGGRVRVTGGHGEIFDFSNVGFFATFGDGLALVIMVAAALSCAIAVFKAHSGFADPIPEYSDYAGGADSFDEDAEDIALGFQERIEEIAEDAEAGVFETTDAPEDQMELVRDVLHFNAEVQDAASDMRAFARAEWERYAYVKGEDVARKDFDASEFEALLIDVTTLKFADLQDDELEALRAAHATAMAEITNAYAGYSATARRSRVLPPNASSPE